MTGESYRANWSAQQGDDWLSRRGWL